MMLFRLDTVSVWLGGEGIGGLGRPSQALARSGSVSPAKRAKLRKRRRER
jgi:hypothetical protein